MGSNANKERNKTTSSNKGEYILIHVAERAAIITNEEQSRPKFSDPNAEAINGQEVIPRDSKAVMASVPRPEEPALVKEFTGRQEDQQEQELPPPPQPQQQLHQQQHDTEMQPQQYFLYQPQQQQYQFSQGAFVPLVTPPTAPQQHQYPPLSPPPEDAADGGDKKIGVPHVYHDYSAVPDAMGYSRKKTGGVTQPFPEKLMDMLTKETDCPSIVGWLPHGRAFIVRKPTSFTSEIMPKVRLHPLMLYAYAIFRVGSKSATHLIHLFTHSCLFIVLQTIKTDVVSTPTQSLWF